MTVIESTEVPKPAAMEPVALLLSRVMRDVGAVGKDERNASQGFNFRGVDAVVNAVSPALQRHGIVVLPHLDSVERGTTIAKSGGQIANVYVVVTYTFYGPAGDSISARVAAESFDSGDKATAKAMSVAFRIALLQSLALPTDEPDPDQHTYEQVQHSPAEERRIRLGRLVRHKGLDINNVAQEYQGQYGVSITAETNVDNLDEFGRYIQGLGGGEEK